MNSVRASLPKDPQAPKDETTSILYITEVLNKIYLLPSKIKTLITLINTPYTGKDIRILEQQVKQELREEIIGDLFYICDNLDRPEILDNKTLRLQSGARYGYQGRGIEKERLLY